MMNMSIRTFFHMVGVVLLTMIVTLPGLSLAETTGFHFESICRSDAAVKKNTVTVVLHGSDLQAIDGNWQQDHWPLANVTINALWTYVDYRQNHAVFRYKQDSYTTADDGSCTFHGGSGRARWQLSEVVGYNMSSPAFDTVVTVECPNTMMIDFW